MPRRSQRSFNRESRGSQGRKSIPRNVLTRISDPDFDSSSSQGNSEWWKYLSSYVKQRKSILGKNTEVLLNQDSFDNVTGLSQDWWKNLSHNESIQFPKRNVNVNIEVSDNLSDSAENTDILINTSEEPKKLFGSQEERSQKSRFSNAFQVNNTVKASDESENLQEVSKSHNYSDDTSLNNSKEPAQTRNKKLFSKKLSKRKFSEAFNFNDDTNETLNSSKKSLSPEEEKIVKINHNKHEQKENLTSVKEQKRTSIKILDSDTENSVNFTRDNSKKTELESSKDNSNISSKQRRSKDKKQNSFENSFEIDETINISNTKVTKNKLFGKKSKKAQNYSKINSPDVKTNESLNKSKSPETNKKIFNKKLRKYSEAFSDSKLITSQNLNNSTQSINEKSNISKRSFLNSKLSNLSQKTISDSYIDNDVSPSVVRKSKKLFGRKSEKLRNYSDAFLNLTQKTFSESYEATDISPPVVRKSRRFTILADIDEDGNETINKSKGSPAVKNKLFDKRTYKLRNYSQAFSNLSQKSQYDSSSESDAVSRKKSQNITITADIHQDLIEKNNKSVATPTPKKIFEKTTDSVSNSKLSNVDYNDITPVFDDILSPKTRKSRRLTITQDKINTPSKHQDLNIETVDMLSPVTKKLKTGNNNSPKTIKSNRLTLTKENDTFNKSKSETPKKQLFDRKSKKLINYSDAFTDSKLSSNDKTEIIDTDNDLSLKSKKSNRETITNDTKDVLEANSELNMSQKIKKSKQVIMTPSKLNLSKETNTEINTDNDNLSPNETETDIIESYSKLVPIVQLKRLTSINEPQTDKNETMDKSTSETTTTKQKIFKNKSEKLRNYSEAFTNSKLSLTNKTITEELNTELTNEDILQFKSDKGLTPDKNETINKSKSLTPKEKIFKKKSEKLRNFSEAFTNSKLNLSNKTTTELNVDTDNVSSIMEQAKSDPTDSKLKTDHVSPSLINEVQTEKNGNLNKSKSITPSKQTNSKKINLSNKTTTEEDISTVTTESNETTGNEIEKDVLETYLEEKTISVQSKRLTQINNKLTDKIDNTLELEKNETINESKSLTPKEKMFKKKSGKLRNYSEAFSNSKLNLSNKTEKSNINNESNVIEQSKNGSISEENEENKTETDLSLSPVVQLKRVTLTNEVQNDKNETINKSAPETTSKQKMFKKKSEKLRNYSEAFSTSKLNLSNKTTEEININNDNESNVTEQAKNGSISDENLQDKVETDHTLSPVVQLKRVTLTNEVQTDKNETINKSASETTSKQKMFKKKFEKLHNYSEAFSNSKFNLSNKTTEELNINNDNESNVTEQAKNGSISDENQEDRAGTDLSLSPVVQLERIALTNEIQTDKNETLNRSKSVTPSKEKRKSKKLSNSEAFSNSKLNSSNKKIEELNKNNDKVSPIKEQSQVEASTNNTQEDKKENDLNEKTDHILSPTVQSKRLPLINDIKTDKNETLNKSKSVTPSKEKRKSDRLRNSEAFSDSKLDLSSKTIEESNINNDNVSPIKEQSQVETSTNDIQEDKLENDSTEKTDHVLSPTVQLKRNEILNKSKSVTPSKEKIITRKSDRLRNSETFLDSKLNLSSKTIEESNINNDKVSHSKEQSQDKTSTNDIQEHKIENHSKEKTDHILSPTVQLKRNEILNKSESITPSKDKIFNRKSERLRNSEAFSNSKLNLSNKTTAESNTNNDNISAITTKSKIETTANKIQQDILEIDSDGHVDKNQTTDKPESLTPSKQKILKKKSEKLRNYSEAFTNSKLSLTNKTITEELNTELTNKSNKVQKDILEFEPVLSPGKNETINKSKSSTPKEKIFKKKSEKLRNFSEAFSNSKLNSSNKTTTELNADNDNVSPTIEHAKSDPTTEDNNKTDHILSPTVNLTRGTLINEVETDKNETLNKPKTPSKQKMFKNKSEKLRNFSEAFTNSKLNLSNKTTEELNTDNGNVSPITEKKTDPTTEDNNKTNSELKTDHILSPTVNLKRSTLINEVQTDKNETLNKSESKTPSKENFFRNKSGKFLKVPAAFLNSELNLSNKTTEELNTDKDNVSLIIKQTETDPTAEDNNKTDHILSPTVNLKRQTQINEVHTDKNETINKSKSLTPSKEKIFKRKSERLRNSEAFSNSKLNVSNITTAELNTNNDNISTTKTKSKIETTANEIQDILEIDSNGNADKNQTIDKPESVTPSKQKIFKKKSEKLRNFSEAFSNSKLNLSSKTITKLNTDNDNESPTKEQAKSDPTTEDNNKIDSKLKTDKNEALNKSKSKTPSKQRKSRNLRILEAVSSSKLNLSNKTTEELNIDNGKIQENNIVNDLGLTDNVLSPVKLNRLTNNKENDKNETIIKSKSLTPNKKITMNINAENDNISPLKEQSETRTTAETNLLSPTKNLKRRTIINEVQTDKNETLNKSKSITPSKQRKSKNLHNYSDKLINSKLNLSNKTTTEDNKLEIETDKNATINKSKTSSKQKLFKKESNKTITTKSKSETIENDIQDEEDGIEADTESSSDNDLSPTDKNKTINKSKLLTSLKLKRLKKKSRKMHNSLNKSKNEMVLESNQLSTSTNKNKTITLPREPLFENKSDKLPVNLEEPVIKKPKRRTILEEIQEDWNEIISEVKSDKHNPETNQRNEINSKQDTDSSRTSLQRTFLNTIFPELKLTNNEATTSEKNKELSNSKVKETQETNKDNSNTKKRKLSKSKSILTEKNTENNSKKELDKFYTVVTDDKNNKIGENFVLSPVSSINESIQEPKKLFKKKSANKSLINEKRKTLGHYDSNTDLAVSKWSENSIISSTKLNINPKLTDEDSLLKKLNIDDNSNNSESTKRKPDGIIYSNSESPNNNVSFSNNKLQNQVIELNPISESKKKRRSSIVHANTHFESSVARKILFEKETTKLPTKKIVSKIPIKKPHIAKPISKKRVSFNKIRDLTSNEVKKLSFVEENVIVKSDENQFKKNVNNNTKISAVFNNPELESSDDEIPVINLDSSDEEVRTKSSIMKSFKERQKEADKEKTKKLQNLLLNALDDDKTNPELTKTTSTTQAQKPEKKITEFFNKIVRKDYEKMIQKELQAMKEANKVRKRKSTTTVVDKIKYKPEKLFRGKRWCTPLFYQYLQNKLKTKFDEETVVKRSEELMKFIVESVLIVIKSKKRLPREVQILKRELARNAIVKTNYDFYCFVADFLPYEYRIKVVPCTQPYTSEPTVPYNEDEVFEDISI